MTNDNPKSCTGCRTLEAENARLRAMDDRAHKLIDYWSDRAEKAEAENARLKEEYESLDNLAKGSIEHIQKLEREKAELVEALDDLVSQVKHLEYPATALDLDQARAVLAKGGE